MDWSVALLFGTDCKSMVLQDCVLLWSQFFFGKYLNSLIMSTVSMHDIIFCVGLLAGSVTWVLWHVQGKRAYSWRPPQLRLDIGLWLWLDQADYQVEGSILLPGDGNRTRRADTANLQGLQGIFKHEDPIRGLERYAILRGVYWS